MTFNTNQIGDLTPAQRDHLDRELAAANTVGALLRGICIAMGCEHTLLDILAAEFPSLVTCDADHLDDVIPSEIADAFDEHDLLEALEGAYGYKNIEGKLEGFRALNEANQKGELTQHSVIAWLQTLGIAWPNQ